MIHPFTFLFHSYYYNLAGCLAFKFLIENLRFIMISLTEMLI